MAPKPLKALADMTEPELGELMRGCARAVDQALRVNAERPDHRHKFVLVIFDDPAVAQHISSCHREDMIKAMRETADRLERKQDVVREE